MVWTKLDDGILDHPKIASVGPIGYALFTASIVYANRNLTDGFVPYGVARRLLTTQWTDDSPSRSDLPPPDGERGPRIWSLSITCGMTGLDGEDVVDRLVDALCRAELWTEVPHGFLIHDFLDWNPSKEDVEAERLKKQAAGRAGGRAAAIARATASADTPAVAESKPVPVPVPVPVPKNSRTRATRASALSSPDQFEKFWEAFEYKVDRAHAETAWSTQIAAGADPDAIIAGALAYARWWTEHPDPPTHKYAQGWLSAQRWNDVLPPYPSTNGNSHAETTAERLARLEAQ